ncbi:MAG: phage major capsid protein [Alphaproteobacteria bacterium]|nr:phage major capsid protein [Alphaproteobacteria bacterium]
MQQIDVSAQDNCACDNQLRDIQGSYLKMDTRMKALEMAYKRPAVDGVRISSPLSQKSQCASIKQGRLGFVGFNQHQHGGKNMLHQFLRSGQEYGQKSLTTTDARSNTILIPASTQDFVEKVIPDYSPLRKIARVTHITTDSLELLMDKGRRRCGVGCRNRGTRRDGSTRACQAHHWNPRDVCTTTGQSKAP